MCIGEFEEGYTFTVADWYRWDFATCVEEVMRHLHSFVMARQVLYLGASNIPAWVVVKANDCEPHP